MSQLTSIPKQSYFSAQLQSPIDSSQTSGIILTSVPDFAFGGNTFYFNIVDGNNSETISATGVSGNELTGVTRAVATYSGETATAYAHAAGVTVVLSDDWKYWEAIQTAVNSKADLDSPSFTTDIQVPVYADATARDAGIPSPSNGMIVYNTADGLFQAYQGGSWMDLDTGAAQPNATQTIAGKIEIATDAELAAGTDIGGTGASVVAVPSQIAEVVQNSKFSYASTGGAADAYTLTLAPAVTAYTAGQIFIAKIHAANTGASTIDVNGLGAKTIKKNNDVDVAAGDIETDQIVVLGYDGTNMQMLSQIAAQLMSAADAATLTNGSNADALHTHDFSKLLLTNTTAVAVENTAVQQTMYSENIPADTLITTGSNNAVRWIIYVADLDLSANQNVIILVKYGTATILNHQITADAAARANNEGVIYGDIVATGDAAQKYFSFSNITNKPTTLGSTYVGVRDVQSSTTAIDGTSDQNFEILVTFSNASVNDRIAISGIVLTHHRS